MPEPLIKIERLTKTYFMGDVEVHALRGVDLSIRAGEFIAIMGASGSGKTTLMNLIGCLDKPTSGTYNLDGIGVHTIDDEDLAHLRNQKIGYVFQSFYLLPRTTAYENVELPLLYRTKLSHQERKELTVKALRNVSIEDRSHHYPNQLSGGQQQRVAIARAIVNEPVLLLADEPTGNLDSRTSVFQELHQKGITVILVTHEPDISQYAQRIISFRDGKIRSDFPNPKYRSAIEDLKALPPLEED
jgi:putative ABC transport system ATP-binding protein